MKRKTKYHDNKGKICIEEGCMRGARCELMCLRHYEANYKKVRLA